MTNRSIASVPFVLLCLVGTGLRGQAIDPGAFTTAENRIFAHAAKLERHEALEALLTEMRAQSAQSGDEALRRRKAAYVEYLASNALDIASGFADPRRIRQAFLELAGTPLAQASPTLRDALRIQVMAVHHVLGDDAARTALRRDLGFIHDWWTIGPFDNERGSGFGRAFGPETKLDFDKSYKGKKRDVRWRLLPFAPARGWIALRTIVRPMQQVLCHVATTLEAKADKDVLLRLGTSESFEVYLNGKRLTGRSLRRRFEYDQDAIVLPLRAGPNLLMLRISTQEGGLSFAARLREPNGRPVEGITVQTGKENMLAAAQQTPRDRRLRAEPFRGARSVFGTEPADAFRLASILAFYHGEDESDSKVLDLLRLSAKGLPGEAAPIYSRSRARIRNRVTAAKEENPRRHDLEEILRIQPDHGRTLIELARLELRSTRAANRAESLLRRALKTQPDDKTVRLVLADSMKAAGLPRLARRELDRAARSDRHGNFLSRARRRRGNALLSESRFGPAAECFTSLLARENNVVDRMSLATLLLRTGKRDAAVKMLKAGISRNPTDSRLRFKLSRLLEAEGNVAEAMEPLQSWLSICPEDDAAFIELARLYGMLGQVDRQREFLRSAVTLNPNRKQDRRLLEFLESGAKPFYADYEISGDAAIAKDRGAPADAAQANDPFYYLMSQRVVHAYRNGTTSEYRHFMVRILNEQGSKQFARYSVPHYWGEQRARLLSVKIHKLGGRVRRPQLRGASAELPSLGIGDVVEVRYRVDDTAPGFFGDYFGFEHVFAGGPPTRASSLVVVLDKGREYQLQAANGAPQPTRIRDTAGNAVWSFEMRDLARLKSETRQPAATESAPLVRITTYESWNAFASWWFNLIKNQTEVSPGIRAKVEELTTGLATQKEKIDAIYRFVTTDVRYEAWEFGVHGYKPYSTPVIFERRHGDCKDKSLLLNVMLSLVGVKAHPVLIHADSPRSKDDLSLPMVNHFNHCISYVEPTDETPGMFLDGTATYHPLDTLPDMDHGAEVLVVRGPRGDIRTIAWPEPDTNRDETAHDIRLQPNGDADVDCRMQPTRNRAVWVRNYLGNEPAKRREHLEQILKRDFGTIEIGKFAVGPLLDLRKPVAVEVAFRAKAFAVQQGKGLVLKSAIGAASLAQLALAETRTMPLLLDLPHSEVHSIRYGLPRGWDALNLPKRRTLRSEFGFFDLEWQRADGALLVKRTLRIHTQRVAPDKYAAFREFASSVDEATRQVVVIEKKGGE